VLYCIIISLLPLRGEIKITITHIHTVNCIQLAPSVRSACAALIMLSAVVISIDQSVPDCAVVVRSAFSETRGVWGQK